jgi:hypothetical protein
MARKVCVRVAGNVNIFIASSQQNRAGKSAGSEKRSSSLYKPVR